MEIIGDDLFAGSVSSPPPLAIELGISISRSAVRRLVEATMIAAFAGLPAQRLVDPRADDAAADSDRRLAFELSRDYGVVPRRPAKYAGHVGDDVHRAYLARFERRAAALVRAERRAIGALAAVLLERRAIEGKELLVLVDRLLTITPRL